MEKRKICCECRSFAIWQKNGVLNQTSILSIYYPGFNKIKRPWGYSDRTKSNRRDSSRSFKTQWLRKYRSLAQLKGIRGKKPWNSVDFWRFTKHKHISHLKTNSLHKELMILFKLRKYPLYSLLGIISKLKCLILHWIIKL